MRDPHDLEIWSMLNDVPKQKVNTKNMIFKYFFHFDQLLSC